MKHIVAVLHISLTYKKLYACATHRPKTQCIPVYESVITLIYGAQITVGDGSSTTMCLFVSHDEYH